ncbi:MAG: hypothetical protein ACP5KB_06740 [Thermoprotei archaeon]
MSSGGEVSRIAFPVPAKASVPIFDAVTIPTRLIIESGIMPMSMGLPEKYVLTYLMD